MKWAFLVALFGLIPVLTIFLRSKPQYLVHASFLFGACMFVFVPSAWTAPIAWPGWPGPVKGLEVNIIDPIAVALILATRPIRIPVHIVASFAFFFLAVLISTFAAQQWVPSFFYIFQVVRAALVFVAASRVSATVPRADVSVVFGLGAGLVYESVLAVYQYHTGDPRPGGNLGHSNFLGLASDFVAFPTIAILLGTRRFLWPATILICDFVIVLVGGSRASLGLLAIGTALVIIFSLLHRTTSRKLTFTALAALLLIGVIPIASVAGNRRSEESKASSDTERTAMKSAATMMIQDHPFGVGPNEYVLVANTGGYSQRAGVAWNYTSRSAPVHDVYYLVAAEMGLLGLFGFIAMLGSLTFVGFRRLRQKVEGDSAELIPGLLAMMLVVIVHISFEWVFMHFVLHYIFAVEAGILVGVSARMSKLAENSRPAHRLVAPLPAA